MMRGKYYVVTFYDAWTDHRPSIGVDQLAPEGATRIVGKLVKEGEGDDPYDYYAAREDADGDVGHVFKVAKVSVVGRRELKMEGG